MPSFRGIEVSIFTQSEIDRLPEYPHPDGSSRQRRDLVTATPVDGLQSQQAVNHDDAARASIANAKISVYVPSLPGAQFWIDYNVEHPPSPPGHLFFKLYMNGRHITSWGINPRIRSQGRVEKALYKPSDRWDQVENGVVFKPEGIEARYFYFIGDQKEQSVADDGGLIEVQVFRAKGRKKRAARLDQYRVQDKYGITTPSGGLLDNPQDVTFFDFHLIDPKDSPFASFRFHYRSMKNLYQLNLVPSDDLTYFGSSLTSIPSNISEPPSEQKVTLPGPQEPGNDTGSFAIHEDPDEDVFDDNLSSREPGTPTQEDSRPRRHSTYVLRTPPQLRPRSATSHNLPQPSKSLRDALTPGFPQSYLHRPLPDRPLPDIPISSPDNSWVTRSRKSSNVSAAASVAPSLLSYVNNGSFLDETVEYGQALEMPMSRAQPEVYVSHAKVAPTAVEARVVAETSSSDYDGSSLADYDSRAHSPILLSPGNYMASTGSMLEKHIARFEDDRYSPCGKTTSPESRHSPEHQLNRNRNGTLGIDLSRFTHLQLSEDDCFTRTPSPEAVPRGLHSPRLGRIWSTLRRNKSRSPIRSLRNPREGKLSKNYSTPQLGSPESKERHGNWI